MQQSRTVLLIEDNPGDARLLEEMLADETRTRLDLVHAGTLAEGLRRLESSRPDAVLIDLGLPDSSGIETFTRLQARFPDVPAVVLTGNVDVDLAIRAVQAGAQDYLVKGEVAGNSLVRAIQYAIERKKAEDALRRSEAILRSFYENSPMMMGVVELTEEGEIVHVYDNPVTARFFASLDEPTSSRSARGLGAPEEAIALWVDSYRRAEELGRPVSFEYLHDPAGKAVWLSAHVATIGRGSSGRTQFCYVAEDVTERKTAEAEVRRLNAELEDHVRLRTAQLEAANRELEAFSYSVSHDLRAPLRAIQGFSRILGESAGRTIGDEDRRSLDRIAGAAERMSQLIDDLLSLSRVGRQSLGIADADLSALAREICAELRESEPERVVEFVVDEGVHGSGDVALLRIVLQNLLSNAWKFTAKKPVARIEFGRAGTARGPACFVRDDGAGFDARYAERLFTPFARLHSDSEFKGTGIGLAIVQRILARHGGHVWAEGHPGEGATFWFTLG